MLDRYAINIIRSPLKLMSDLLDGQKITANHVTVTGFFIGLFALPMIALQWYWWGLFFIVINRIFDGLDG